MRLAILGLDSTHTDFFCQRLQEFKPKVELYFHDDNEVILQERIQKYGGYRLNLEDDHKKKRFDLVMIVSRFGDEHLKYFQKSLNLSQFIFIDKPLAACRKDAMDMLFLAKANNTSVRSHTPLLYSKEFLTARKILKNNSQITNLTVSGPLYCRDLEGDHRFMSPLFYGIHACEMFLTLFSQEIEKYDYSIEVIDRKAVSISLKRGSIEFTFLLIDESEEFYKIEMFGENELFYSKNITLDGSYYEHELKTILDTENWGDLITDEFVISLRSVELLEQVERRLND